MFTDIVKDATIALEYSFRLSAEAVNNLLRYVLEYCVAIEEVDCVVRQAGCACVAWSNISDTCGLQQCGEVASVQEDIKPPTERDLRQASDVSDFRGHRVQLSEHFPYRLEAQVAHMVIAVNPPHAKQCEQNRIDRVPASADLNNGFALEIELALEGSQLYDKSTNPLTQSLWRTAPTRLLQREVQALPTGHVGQDELNQYLKLPHNSLLVELTGRVATLMTSSLVPVLIYYSFECSLFLLQLSKF